MRVRGRGRVRVKMRVRMRVGAYRRLVGEAIPDDEKVWVELLREVEVEALGAVAHRAALLELAHLVRVVRVGMRIRVGVGVRVGVRVRVGVGVKVRVRVILELAHHVLDKAVGGRVSEAEVGQVRVEALGVLDLEHVEPVPRPPLGVVLLEELRCVVERPVDQLHLG